jgi:hypothetical protein
VVARMGPLAQEDALKLRLGVPPTGLGPALPQFSRGPPCSGLIVFFIFRNNTSGFPHVFIYVLGAAPSLRSLRASIKMTGEQMPLCHPRASGGPGKSRRWWIGDPKRDTSRLGTLPASVGMTWGQPIRQAVITLDALADEGRLERTFRGQGRAS